MSNFICPICGINNIDCGKAGYKTDREIELEKKLVVAVEALQKIGEVNTNRAIDSFQRCQMIAEKTLTKIKGIE